MMLLNNILGELGTQNVSTLHDLIDRAETEAMRAVFELVIENGGKATVDEMVNLSGGMLSVQMLTANLENINYFATRRTALYDNYKMSSSTERIIKYVVECNSEGQPLPNARVLTSTKRVTVYHISRTGLNR